MAADGEARVHGRLKCTEMRGEFLKDVEGIMFNKQDPMLVLRVDPRGDGPLKEPKGPLPESEDVRWTETLNGAGKTPKWKKTIRLPIDVRCAWATGACRCPPLPLALPGTPRSRGAPPRVAVRVVCTRRAHRLVVLV